VGGAENDPQSCDGRAPPGPVRARLDKFFQNDFFTTLLWARLFPDMLQRFIPHPIFRWDTAYNLERNIEYLASDSSVDADGYLAKPIGASWQPTGLRPALAIGATQVETGELEVLSPFRAWRICDSQFGDLCPNDPQLEWRASGVASLLPISITTAAVASARFPFLTPPAFVPDPEEWRRGDYHIWQTLVDGGYYDNSGLVLAKRLKDYLETPNFATRFDLNIPFEVRIVSLGSNFVPEARSSTTESEFLAPFSALLAARIRLGETTRKTIIDEVGLRLYNFELRNHPYRIPLGWFLSQGTRDLIAAQTPIPGICAFVDGLRNDEEADKKLLEKYDVLFPDSSWAEQYWPTLLRDVRRVDLECRIDSLMDELAGNLRN
jgi:hypothetical protein